MNDSPPKFLPPWTSQHPVYNLKIYEEQPIGTVVGTFIAVDDDSDISKYVILPPSEYFEINNGTGNIPIST